MKEHSAAVAGSKRHRDMESAGPVRVSPPPPGSAPAAQAATRDETESGEVSSGEEGEGSSDDGSEGTHSTRTEDSDFLARKQRAKHNRGGNAAGPRRGSNRVVHSDTESDGQGSAQDRAHKKQSRDKLLRSGRYTEQEDMEIWMAFTAADGEPPAKLGKTLSRVARKLHRTYSSVVGRLERLLAQQNVAKDQYAPSGDAEEDEEGGVQSGTATEGEEGVVKTVVLQVMCDLLRTTAANSNNSACRQQ